MIYQSRLVDSHKKRLIKELLSYKEEEVDGYLPTDLSDELRSVILDAVNSCFRSVNDVINAESNNDVYLERLERAVNRLEVP